MMEKYDYHYIFIPAALDDCRIFLVYDNSNTYKRSLYNSCVCNRYINQWVMFFCYIYKRVE